MFRNYQASHGVAFPTSRPMFAYSSIWAAEDWATQGGRVKTDWSKAPFVANYDNIHLDICECGAGGCATSCPAAAAQYNGRVPAEHRGAGEDAVGAGQLQDLRLLRRPQALDLRPEAGRVRPDPVLIDPSINNSVMGFTTHICTHTHIYRLRS